MAENVLSRRQGQWMSVSSLPSVNLTNGVPVPYNVVSQLAQAQGASGNVNANTSRVHKDDKTVMPTTQGDEPGTGKGVKSGTVGKQSWNVQKSSNVKVNDQAVVRNDDKTDMEGDKLTKEQEEMKKRQECREEQVKAGLASKDKMTQLRAQRFSQNISAAQYARLSNDVYSPGGPLTGWINESGNPQFLNQNGIASNQLTGPGAYRAQVYRPDPAVWGNNPRFGTTVAFQGTTGVFNGDMSANIGQGLRFQTDYYNRAMGIGRSTRAAGANVTFTGHSLGGGMASAASQASGYRGWTFNPAGLSSNTVRNPLGNGSQIHAYYVRGEILRGMQQPGIMGALGTLGGSLITGAVMPNAVGIPHELNARSFSPANRHKMGDVMPGIEDQKQEDQQAIANNTGKKC